ncbi:SRPBCC domain-containing protein [Spirilliplanes yamanashiensis]|uniref:Activator of Hsp90 ATPase homologue 1/2-like C-terminal domain-containing protein n=1 Tax=Spirilliplanes yamanashiensis TaxID=42233 RepID=A0A8J4DHP8_9ACTN|nr:SRPBCC domain-containing protein [Spirilliplanes yamanashiensis]MDP9814669.1 uncharacterized protein YndB with AHSA1/START domain [Spirilliplanes yamanashiensis]GIJ02322.1 hypothetical protein Sya03_16740 [Spirilliplanes yamanashiensis]
MASGLVLGRLRAGVGGAAVRFELRFPVPVAELWSALTVPERLARWLAPVDGQRRPGATVRLLFGLDAVAAVTIEDCLPERRLDLRYVFPDGLATRLRAEVRADGGDSSVLTLDHSGFPGSPVESAAAWQVALDGLAAELAGRLQAPDPAAFEELSGLYGSAWRRLTAD